MAAPFARRRTRDWHSRCYVKICFGLLQPLPGFPSNDTLAGLSSERAFVQISVWRETLAVTRDSIIHRL
ncbi:hypothetical protein [Paenibacillus sp. P3E]|uniref:hypothetical protein n=1 Tax=Paenibacillus sp. P3E TaxID=1349435 RepID=UPI000A689E73|nr:hypothetical protein [Paenibacillus sp. P3E]